MTDYDLALEIKDVLGSATPTPDAVEIYPKGRESKRPEGAKSQWITIVPDSRKIIQELNNAYISEVVYKITGVIDSKDSLGTIAQDVINFSESVHALLSSRQLPYARRIPSLVDTDFEEGDLSSVYGFTILATYETQVARGTQHTDILTWREQTDADITVTVEGLETSEYQFRKANGETGTSGTEYAGASTGTGKIRVLDSADLTKLERVQLDVKGPTAPSKTVPDCAALTEAAANLAITAAGLTPDSDGAFSASVAKGLVISQSPTAGTAVYAGSTVTITVSFGTEYTAVPVTKDLLPAAAEAALIAAGLVLGTSTSSMTNDTAAGLVASSSPAAGTGVAAGTAVDLTVSLGDRHTRIPVRLFPGGSPAIQIAPTAVFDWLLPDGSIQNGVSPVTTAIYPFRSSLVAPQYAYVVMKAGHTVDELTHLMYGVYLNCQVNLSDLKYIRPSVYNFQNSCFVGDVAELKDTVGNATSGVYIAESYQCWGSINDWVAVKADRVLLYSLFRVSGVLKFQTNAPVTQVNFTASTGFPYSDVAQTIINWNTSNAGTFARVGAFTAHKRSLIGAANPAAEAAIVSLSNKGCSFTFASE